MSNWFVVIVETKTQQVVKRMGPMSERKAETTLTGVIRQMDQEHFCAAIEKEGSSNEI